jgi:predicted adenylyl cyclase CyaB
VPRNIEIKARAQDWERQKTLARDLSDQEPEYLFQEDTFFNVPAGRLKLRVFQDGTGELIQYAREDADGPKESRYTRATTNDPQALKTVLSHALGIIGVVRKKRAVLMVGQSRIHLDEVEGLGNFLEIEVVLDPDQKAETGVEIAEELMTNLEIRKEDLIGSAYIDLLMHVRLIATPTAVHGI